MIPYFLIYPINFEYHSFDLTSAKSDLPLIFSPFCSEISLAKTVFFRYRIVTVRITAVFDSLCHISVFAQRTYCHFQKLYNCNIVVRSESAVRISENIRRMRFARKCYNTVFICRACCFALISVFENYRSSGFCVAFVIGYGNSIKVSVIKRFSVRQGNCYISLAVGTL